MLTTLPILVMSITLGTGAPLPLVDVDLREIGHIQSKGRVQDKVYNPDVPVVDGLVAAGPSAISFLLSKLEDETRIEGNVLDFWSEVRVGDVALMILCDLFLAPDSRTPTVPGLTWDAILERPADDVPSSELLYVFVSKHGRAEIRHRVERLLAPYGGRFVWDPKERCFKPAN